MKKKSAPYMLALRWLMLVVLLTLMACSGTDTASTPQDVPRGGELRWSVDGISDLSELDPAHASEQQSIIVMNLIFGGLVRLDADLKVEPDAAESWEVSQDGKTYTFTLRKNVQFGDGTPVTAHDFVYSVNRALSPETGAYGAPSHLKPIVGAEDVIEGEATEASGLRALDEQTVQIELDEPRAYFLAQLTSVNTFFVPKHLIEEKGDTWSEEAFGTGPFRVKEWQHYEEIVLEANPHYWRGQPGIDTIRMPFFQDSAESYERYLQNELDIVGNRQIGIPSGRVEEAQQLPGFQSAPALALRYIGFNNTIPPFDNTSVRRAFALSVDRLDLAQSALQNTVEPTSRILPRGLAGSKLPVTGQAFDPDGARAALRLAGFLSGSSLPPVTLTYAKEGDNALVAETLQRYWRDTLGVDVNIQGIDLDTFSQRLDETYETPDRGLQMYLSIWGADYPDPQNFLSQQLRSGLPNNNGHWFNAEFDELVDEADTMGAQEKIDERLELYNKAEQIALDEVGWMPLYNPRMNILLRPTVQGLVFTPQDIIARDWTMVRIVPPEQAND